MSERNGYEHGVPSWIAGAHADPDQAAAFYTELFGWDAERRGEHLVCTLRGRDVAGFVRGDEPAWRTHVWVESADETAERAHARRAARSLTAPVRRRPASAAAAVARRPRRRRLHRRRARPPPRRPGRQRARRVGDERALDARHRGRARPSTRAVFGWETDSVRRRCHAVAPPGLRRRRAGAAGPARRRRGRQPGETPRWDVDFWVDDVDAAAEQAAAARRHRADRPARRRRRSGRTRRPRRPAGRARSPSAAWCPHEHDRGRQPRHARRRHAGARPPRRGPPRRLRARRLGQPLLRRRPGRVHGRADGPAAAARCCSAAGPTRRCRAPGRSSRRTTRSGRCSSATRSTSSRARTTPSSG